MAAGGGATGEQAPAGDVIHVQLVEWDWIARKPTRTVGTFEARQAAAGDTRFLYQGGEYLKSGTDYAIRISAAYKDSTSATLAQTASNDEDDGGQPGWNLWQRSLRVDAFAHGNPQWEWRDNALQVRVNARKGSGDAGLYVHDAEVYEAHGATLDFKVTLDPAPSGNQTVTVGYKTQDSSSGICDFHDGIDGDRVVGCRTTARYPSDYLPVRGELTFGAGETLKTVSVPVVDDDVPDSGEGVALLLFTPRAKDGADVPALARDAALGIIYNHEEASEPSEVRVSDARAAEGGELLFVVSLSSPATATVTVDYATSDGTATAGADYAHASGTLTFPAGETSRTVSVPALEDAETEGDETLALTLDNVVHAVFAGNAASVAATGTIAADEAASLSAAPPALSVADASATEEADASLSFAVTLDAPSAGPVTVDYATSDGTAQAPDDYAQTSGTLTFAAGETARAVAVAIVDDDAADGGETLTLTLSNPSGATLADAAALGTIADGDLPPLTARFQDVPAGHDGASAFVFRVLFSEPIPTSYRVLRDDGAFRVAGGTVRRARRVDGRDDLREIHVRPAGRGAVTVTLPPTTDCAAKGAICMDDGRRLSAGDTATVAGPAAAVVDGRRLTLSWRTPPDAFAAPDGSDFAVTVDGVLRPVASVRFHADGVALLLSAPVHAAQAVAVDHLGSAMHPLRGAAGELRPAWRGLPALNVTGWPAEARSEAGVSAPAPNPAPVVWDAARSASLAGRELGDADLASLAGMTGLRRLDLSDTGLVDLSALSGLRGLESLDLSGNAIADLAPLAGLAELRRLDLGGNRIGELWPVGGLPNLEVLLLDGNRVSDVGALTHLVRVETLGLSGNRVVDVGALADLGSLRRLDLGGNPVRDLSPVGDVGTLEWLGSPLAEVGVPAHRLPRLRWLLAPVGPAACLGCAPDGAARAPAR